MKFFPHANVLRLIAGLNYGIGKMLAVSVLIGDNTSQVKRLHLHKKLEFGSLELHTKEDLLELIDILVRKGFLEYSKERDFYKTLKITEKGREELKNPKELTVAVDRHQLKIEAVTDAERAAFREFPELSKLTDEQKKAVIHPGKDILCIAGAGTGKTTVLTWRAYFLAKYRGISPQSILAITFTRKARDEMLSRLSKMPPADRVQVETFNSFCERMLRQHEEQGKCERVMGFREMKDIFISSLKDAGYAPRQALEEYYTKKKLSDDEVTLFLRMMYDFYSVLELTKAKGLSPVINDPRFASEVLEGIRRRKKELCLRDFCDQIINTIELFNSRPDTIPGITHLLVDEYQDVNDIQVDLIRALSPGNVFAVGDPRQSIYGWRGSRITHIMDFGKDSTVVQLKSNFRSTGRIVSFANSIIKPMKLHDLKAEGKEGEKIVLISHPSHDQEYSFLCQSILACQSERSGIMVLARTNKQLEEIEPHMRSAGIRYLKRTTEMKKEEVSPEDDQVTLSTVHAAKGLEADMVYIVGANSLNFPCNATEHPLLEGLRNDDSYDKIEEERRLFYVASTRAKERLVISYCGMLSPFVRPSALSQVEEVSLKPELKVQRRQDDDFLREEDLVY